MSNFLPVNDPMYIHDLVTATSSSSDQSTEMVETQAMEETMLENEENSPEATNKAYSPKIKEFQVWCDDVYRHSSIEQRFTVTGDKLYLFLKTMVINRVSRRSDQEDRVIQLATIYKHVAAITHYYQAQVSQKTNDHPHPRSACIAILKTCRMREENAGTVGELDTLIDDYTTTDEIASLSY
ncbi:hypothetical protein INT47_011205 [Mucor saturninus]|uniref:Uncharacterized protein n=1 Tax=Mucor saturninus TaxID=64648 RepID=A0A8H7RKY7_9FUNG|nr:hypothetical protein INT47_011205 [Mucor saturninus]